MQRCHDVATFPNCPCNAYLRLLSLGRRLLGAGSGLLGLRLGDLGLLGLLGGGFLGAGGLLLVDLLGGDSSFWQTESTRCTGSSRLKKSASALTDNSIVIPA